MIGVAVLLAAAAVGYAGARLLRVPSIPLLLLAGLAVSLVHAPSGPILEDALLLGVSFLLFVAGLELDPRRVRAQRTVAIRVGLLQFIILGVIGYGVARLLDFGGVAAAYVALALTASSTLIGVRLLQRRGQMFEPFGRMVLGVLLLQDVLVLLAIPLVTTLAESALVTLESFGAIVMLGAITLAARRWIGPLLLRVAHDEELVLLCALAILFTFVAVSHVFRLPLVVGPFLAGVALSSFPVSAIVRAELAPIGDFFTAIFFTALGALVSIPSPGELGQALVLVAVVLVVTPPLVTIIAERAGLAARSSIEAGLLLSQTSEISLVIGLSGMLAGAIDGSVFTVIALVTLITMLLTPLIATPRVAWWLMHAHPSRRASTAPAASDHVLLLGAGSTGMPLLEDLVISGCDLLVVDDDPGVIDRLAQAGIRTIRGDASDQAVLKRAGADRARLVSSTIRRARDNAILLGMAGEVPVLVRVFDEGDAHWVRDHGGIPVVYSTATAEALVVWFHEEQTRLEENLRGRLSADPSADATRMDDATRVDARRASAANPSDDGAGAAR